jgi:hypothetical protein
MTSGIVLLVVIGVMFLVMFVVALGKPMDEGPGDFEPFDHDPGDPSPL